MRLLVVFVSAVVFFVVFYALRGISDSVRTVVLVTTPVRYVLCELSVHR